MNGTSGLRALAIGIAAALLFAPGVLADTCCANTSVKLEPTAASPGDTVRLSGLRCLAADNSGPLPFNPGGFWLWKGERAAEAQPDMVPGPGLPQDLPPTDTWPAFDGVSSANGLTGEASIRVPQLPDGFYQLWWFCRDGTGPGGGIHYSTGPRLRVGDPPDTATAPQAGGITGIAIDGRGGVLLLVAVLTVIGVMARSPDRRAHV